MDDIPNKSIFSIGDFRHNVQTKEEADYYGSMVPHAPKSFFNLGYGEDEKKK